MSKNMSKKIILVAGLLCGLSSVAMAQSIADLGGMANLGGIYTCSVTDHTLSSSVHVTGAFSLKESGNIYSVSQVDLVSKQPVANEYHVFGLRSGHVLSLAFQKISDPNVFGSEVMQISNHGKTLYGTFIYWDKFDKKNVEVCKKDYVLDPH